MMYTREEIAILPIFLKRVLMKGYLHYSFPLKPANIRVRKRSSEHISVHIHFISTQPMHLNEYRKQIAELAKAYGLNNIYILPTYIERPNNLSSYHNIEPDYDYDYNMYSDFTTKGQLKLIY